MPTIKVRLVSPSSVSFEPSSFLGASFGSFRQALSDAGVRARKVGAIWKNEAPIAIGVKAAALLQSAGFDLDLDEATHKDMTGAVKDAVQDVQCADAILDGIDRDLASRGQRLYQYQREGVRALLSERTMVLGDDMGLGKTLQMLCTIPRNGQALVICPALVKGSFAAEVKRWRPDLSPVILDGRGSFRWPAPGEVVITNYEILPGKSGAYGLDMGEIQRPPSGTVLLVDEIHRCGNSKTLVTERVRALVGLILDEGGRTYGATGTLMRTSPPNIWNILTSLRLNKRAYGSYDGFTSAFGGWQDRFGAWTWPTNPPAQAAEGLRKVMIRRTKEQVAKDLPSCTTSDMTVPVSASLLRKLDKIADRTLAKIKAKGLAQDAKSLSEVSDEDLDKAMKDGSSIGEISAVRETLAMAKVPTAIEWCEDMEAQGEPVLVFSAHVAVAEAIGSRPGWGLITGAVPAEERTRIVADFQAGKLVGVAGTIGAMGVGVTMTRAAQVLFVDLSWTPADNAQARDRAHRHGQTRPVNVTRLVCDHPVDQRIAQVLSEKIERNLNSVEAASVGEDFRAQAPIIPVLPEVKPVVQPTIASDRPRTLAEECPIDF